jgi:hypothetical protein
LRIGLRRIALWVTLLALLWLGYRWIVLQPSNQRDWEYGMDVLAHVTIEDDVVHLQHVRDFRWPADGPPSSRYVGRTYDVRQLARVWFVQEPFTIPWLQGFQGVAHTYFVFDFQDQPPVAVSVETRRERGEGYDAVRGLLNEYELIYIWGTEQDLTGRRVVVERNDLYMYPMVGSGKTARQLFLNLAEESRRLETRPRFYNTFASNCTNELAKAANQAQPGAIPPDPALIFPGYSDGLLYRLGFIPNDAPLEAIRERYAITDAVAELIDQSDFSRLLRLRLNVQQDNAR